VKRITRHSDVEEIINTVPGSLSYLINKGLCGIRCGEELSGTIEEAAVEKGFSGSELENIINMLNELSNKGIKV